MPLRAFLLYLLCVSLLISLPVLAADSLPDPRLDQKVSIECVNVRLHTVIEQLSAQTGVKIDCGWEKKDWQERDIPVTICAEDIPLGTLLRSIADSTHLLLSTSTSGGTKTYRIWRDLKRKRELDDYFAAESNYEGSRGEWFMDLAMKYQNVYDKVPDKTPFTDLMYDVSRLLSAIGRGGRARLMSGEVLRYNRQNAPSSLSGIIDDIFDAYARTPDGQQKGDQSWDPELCPVILHGLTCTIKAPNGQVYSIGFSLYMGDNVFPEDMRADAGVFQQPSFPGEPHDKSMDTRYKALKPWENHDLPILERKVSLKAPEDPDDLTCGRLLADLSKATGYAVVCEDFESYRKSLNVAVLYKDDQKVGDVLDALNRYRLCQHMVGFEWYVDDRARVIVGQAFQWTHRHHGLVAESYLNYLRNKLDNEGVDLDDMVSILTLNEEQIRQWIEQYPDLAIISSYGLPNGVSAELWKIYGTLTAVQKQALFSDAGLTLTPEGDAIMNEYVQHKSRETRRNHAITWVPREEPTAEELASLTPPTSYYSMRVRVEYRPVQRTYRKMVFGNPGQTSFNKAVSPFSEGWVKKKIYSLEVEGIRNGAKVVDPLAGIAGLPIYSPKREAELGIEASEQSKTPTDVSINGDYGHTPAFRLSSTYTKRFRG